MSDLVDRRLCVCSIFFHEAGQNRIDFKSERDVVKRIHGRAFRTTIPLFAYKFLYPHSSLFVALRIGRSVLGPVSVEQIVGMTDKPFKSGKESSEAFESRLMYLFIDRFLDIQSDLHHIAVPGKDEIPVAHEDRAIFFFHLHFFSFLSLQDLLHCKWKKVAKCPVGPHMIYRKGSVHTDPVTQNASASWCDYRLPIGLVHARLIWWCRIGMNPVRQMPWKGIVRSYFRYMQIKLKALPSEEPSLFSGTDWTISS